jgi:hypothetical protein
MASERGVAAHSTIAFYFRPKHPSDLLARTLIFVSLQWLAALSLRGIG